MKKFLITLFLILIGFYLTRALNINLSSGNKLDISSWQNINNITSKINLDNNNLNISGKLVINGKICLSNGKCLGECEDGYIWDNNVNECILYGTTLKTAGKSCNDIYEFGVITDGNYYIKPTGYTGDAFKVYCDMATDGGGWTLIASIADDNNDYWTWGNQSYLYNGNEYGDITNALTKDYQSKAWANLKGEDVLFKANNLSSKYLIYDTIINNQTLSSKYTSNNITVGEFSPSKTVGDWWYECGGLYMSLQRMDSDGDGVAWAKGFIWRSINNNSCNYDDIQGALNSSGATTQEARWLIQKFYNNNFDSGVLNVFIR